MGIDDSNPWPNQGARWTAYHYREIIDGLRAGLDWREIARSIGRTEQAVRGRANLLIEDGPRGGGQAWKRLTERVLTDLDYDWETVARRKHAEKELAWWDETTESLVRAVWEASAPSRNWLRRNRSSGSGMADLTAAIGTSEAEICDRIVELGLATSYAEIADRLGCLPGGALEQRARLDRADSPAALYVLVAAGEFGDILHTSIHASRDDAEEARTKVEDRYSRRGPVTTRILRRVTGRLFGGDPDDDSHDHHANRAGGTTTVATDTDTDTAEPLTDLDAVDPDAPYGRWPSGRPKVSPVPPKLPDSFLARTRATGAAKRNPGP